MTYYLTVFRIKVDVHGRCYQYQQQWHLYRVVLHRPREAIHHGSVHLQHPLHLQTYFEMGSVLKVWPQICDPSPLPSGVFWDYRCDSLMPTSWVEKILWGTVKPNTYQSESQSSYFTSFPLCCSLLQRKVPNKQLYKWSRIVMRKYSLNSNAVGNCKMSTTNKHEAFFKYHYPCHE